MGSGQKAVSEISNLVLTIVIYAIVIGSILGTTAFAAITIVNVTTLSETYGSAITALTAFLVVGATIVGIVWFMKYVKSLFDKKQGLAGLAA
jgi:large-conductance mechanosensitive channel